jgi:hypothetical protein
LVLIHSVSRWGFPSTSLIHGSGLSFALSKLESPEVKVSESGFPSGDVSGISLCSGFGAANIKGFNPDVLVSVCVDCWEADQQFG